MARNEFPNAKVTGPSYGRLPNFAGSYSNWFSEWASLVAQNKSVPDMISMHFLYGNGDLGTSIASFKSFLSAAGITYTGTWNINVYCNPDLLFPSGAAWNIAQLERYNAVGLRANWEGGLALHDYAANLLGKPASGTSYVATATGYYPAREFYVYQYYRHNMTGTRVATSMTPNTLSDTHAVISSTDRTVRILCGSRPNTGNWAVQVNALSSLGLPVSGNITVRTYQFNSATTLYAPVSAPTSLGNAVHAYSGNSLSIGVYQNNPNITWAFEFSY
jgi:hypothetical protein